MSPAPGATPGTLTKSMNDSRQRADGGGSRKIHRKASRLWPSRKQGSVLDWRKNPLESILVSDGQAIPPRCASHALLLTGRVDALGVVEWKTGPSLSPSFSLVNTAIAFNMFTGSGTSGGQPLRCAANPPLWAGSEMQQPILGLYTAPPRLELVVWACLGPPWPSLPAEPCDPPSVGHFSLASKGTERGPHRPACGMR